MILFSPTKTEIWGVQPGTGGLRSVDASTVEMTLQPNVYQALAEIKRTKPDMFQALEGKGQWSLGKDNTLTIESSDPEYGDHVKAIGYAMQLLAKGPANIVPASNVLVSRGLMDNTTTPLDSMAAPSPVQEAPPEAPTAPRAVPGPIPAAPGAGM